MPDILQRTAAASATFPSTATKSAALSAGWREGLAIVNLRVPADDPQVLARVSAALGLELPTEPCTSRADAVHRIVWAGPDDWFVIGPKGEAESIVARLSAALAGSHHAVTDVSSGYTVLSLAGASARDVLAQGCPLDLHPRAFGLGQSAGSHFFKASVWLWQSDEAPTFELLVRRSFMGYVWLMLERCSAEGGLVTRRFV